MKEVLSIKCSGATTTSIATFSASTTSAETVSSNAFFPDDAANNPADMSGKYSVFTIANWFLRKEQMTHKKLQKLCYYAQAWCYAIKGYRLEDTDYQAWVHGPVSPALYERFKNFGYDTICIRGHEDLNIDAEDVELLEDVWETYGRLTGNALEALSHRELPWIEARKGYSETERCTVVIDPNNMKNYYKSISLG